jgi:hypothetical protein
MILVQLNYMLILKIDLNLESIEKVKIIVFQLKCKLIYCKVKKFFSTKEALVILALLNVEIKSIRNKELQQLVLLDNSKMIEILSVIKLSKYLIM